MVMHVKIFLICLIFSATIYLSRVFTNLWWM